MPPPTVPSVAPPIFLPPTGVSVPSGKVFDFHPGIGISEEYSDNFNLTSRDRQSNLRSTLSPSAFLGINGAFTKGRVAFSLGLSHDTSSKENEIHIFPSFIGSVTWDATPLLTLTVSDSLTRSDEPSQADRLSLRQERTVFLSNVFSANAAYQLGPVSTNGYYSFSTFSSEATSTRSSQQTTSHTMGATASTTFYTSNTATLGYAYLISDTSGGESSIDASSTPDNLGAGASHITGHQFTATYQRQLSRQATAGITGSYAIRHTDEARGQGSQDFNDWSVSLFNSYTAGNLTLGGSIGYGQAGGQGSGDTNSTVTTASYISYRFGYALASLSVDSGFSETFAQGQNFGVVETRGVTGTFSYQLTPALGTTASAYYRQNTTTGRSGASNSGDQNTWGALFRIEARLTSWLGLSLDYTHTAVTDSNRAATSSTFGGSYDENRVRLSLSASF